MKTTASTVAASAGNAFADVLAWARTHVQMSFHSTCSCSGTIIIIIIILSSPQDTCCDHADACSFEKLPGGGPITAKLLNQHQEFKPITNKINRSLCFSRISRSGFGAADVFMSFLMCPPIVTTEKLYFNGSYNLSVGGDVCVCSSEGAECGLTTAGIDPQCQSCYNCLLPHINFYHLRMERGGRSWCSAEMLPLTEGESIWPTLGIPCF